MLTRWIQKIKSCLEGLWDWEAKDFKIIKNTTWDSRHLWFDEIFGDIVWNTNLSHKEKLDAVLVSEDQKYSL